MSMSNVSCTIRAVCMCCVAGWLLCRRSHGPPAPQHYRQQHRANSLHGRNVFFVCFLATRGNRLVVVVVTSVLVIMRTSPGYSGYCTAHFLVVTILGVELDW